MKDLRLAIIAVAVIGVAVLAQSAQPASAAFHLMRIHAVMAGLNGDGNVQYVELRMCGAGQPFVAGHTIKFYDGSNTLKATFTFPSSVGMSSLGESILIATSEYNTASTGPGGGGSGGDADFVFSGANTVPANGGDALHPVQGPNGRVTFAEGAGTGCSPSTPVDSVAYGTGTPDYAPVESSCSDALDNDGEGFVNDGCGASPPAESACADAIDDDGDTLVNDGCPARGARPLPSPSNACVLRLNVLAGSSFNNSTQYSVQSTSATAKTVIAGMLTTDLDTPRNNARQVATLGAADTDCDGVSNATDNCPTTVNPGQQNLVHPGTTIGDHCEDPEPDGVFDFTDNCPDDANPSQGNFDGDTPGDACDPDDDNDTVPDTSDLDDDNDEVRDLDEASCGGSTPSSLRPERVDGTFDNVDDDGDTLTDEALPGGSANFDCDGDGYTGLRGGPRLLRLSADGRRPEDLPGTRYDLP